MSNLSAFPYIPENSQATPGLWNYPLSIISANIAALDSGLTSSSPSGDTFSFLTNIETSGGAHFQFLSIGSTPPSYVTTAAITVKVNSAFSDYLYLVDSSAQKSSYIIGSRAGGTADGLNIWDASAATMIASFSKQSIRMWQTVVGRAFDIGGSSFDVRAYGAAGDGVTSDRTAILATLDAASIAGGGVVFFSAGTYLFDGSRLTIPSNVNVHGVGANGTKLVIPTNGAANNVQIRIASASDVAIRNITILESGVTTRLGLYGLISMSSSTRVTIQDVEINGGSGIGIFGEMFSNNVEVSRCYVHNTQADGIHFQRGCNNIRIANCKTEDTGDDSVAFVSHAFNTFGHVRDFVITGCLLGSNKTAVSGSGIAVIGAINGVITSNVIKNTVLSGIRVTEYSDIPSEGTPVVGRILIADNTIQNSGSTTLVGAVLDGITISNARAISVLNNRIWNATNNGINLTNSLVECEIVANSVSSTSNARGITVAPANSAGSYTQLWTDPMLSDGTSLPYVYAHRLRILANHVGKSGTDGIYVSGSATTNIQDVTISGNFVEKTNSTNSTSQIFALFASNVSNCLIAGNAVGDPWGTTTRFQTSAVTSSATNDLLGPVRIVQGGLSIATGGLTTSGGAVTFANNVTAPGFRPSIVGDGMVFTISGGGGQPFIIGNSNAQIDFAVGANGVRFMDNAYSSRVLSFDNTGHTYFVDGTTLFPSRAFSSESSLGWCRSATSTLALSYGTIDLTTGGAMTSIASLKIKSGTNNSCGTAVLGSNGSVNVANTYVKTGDLIFLTDQSPGGTLGDLELGGIRNSSGFTIQSTSVTDTSTVGWLIIRPG